jgi:Homeodomain-like domain
VPFGPENGPMAPRTDALSGDRAASASIRLRPDDRKTLLRPYRSSPAPAVRLRCHTLLLLDAGHPWALIAAALFTSSATINRRRRTFLRGGTDAVLAGTAGRRPGQWWAGMIVRWVVTLAIAVALIMRYPKMLSDWWWPLRESLVLWQVAAAYDFTAGPKAAPAPAAPGGATTPSTGQTQPASSAPNP